MCKLQTTSFAFLDLYEKYSCWNLFVAYHTSKIIQSPIGINGINWTDNYAISSLQILKFVLKKHWLNIAHKKNHLKYTNLVCAFHFLYGLKWKLRPFLTLLLDQKILFFRFVQLNRVIISIEPKEKKSINHD